MAGPSEERHRIAVECHAKAVAGRHREPPDEVLAEPSERAGVAALEEDVPAPAVLDALHRARRGTDDLNARNLARLHEPAHPRRALFGQLRRCGFVRTAEDDV